MNFRAEYIELATQGWLGANLQIRYYGIIIVTAMLIAAFLAARLAKRDKQDPDHIWGALTWAIIPAIIFARLFYVLAPPQSAVAQGLTTAWYFSPDNIFNFTNGPLAIWAGGLNIFGAVVGGGLGAYLYMRRNKLNMPYWMDIAGITLPLGQSIGRWANYINQELYGTVTTLPWGLNIPSDKRVDPYRSLVDYPLDTTRFHPIFLYESLWNLVAFFVLLWLWQRKRGMLRQGDIFLLWVMQYCVIRFLLEFIRVEVTIVAGVNLWQTVSAVGFVVALVIFLLRRRSAPAAQKAKAT